MTSPYVWMHDIWHIHYNIPRLFPAIARFTVKPTDFTLAYERRLILQQAARGLRVAAYVCDCRGALLAKHGWTFKGPKQTAPCGRTIIIATTETFSITSHCESLSLEYGPIRSTSPNQSSTIHQTHHPPTSLQKRLAIIINKHH